MATIALLHGGFYPDMDAARFWVDPGIAAGLTDRGHDVLTPNRLAAPPSWEAEVAHLLEVLPPTPVHVLGASNGSGAAARLAIDHPDRVASVVFVWPATAGIAELDKHAAAGLAELGVANPAPLLAGETLRGATDAELASLKHLAAVIAADPPDVSHRAITVARLLATVPAISDRGAFPVPFAPHFRASLEAFVSAIDGFLRQDL